MSFLRPSAKRLLARFEDRPVLSREDAKAAYWSALAPEPLSAIADLIELEMSVPFGLLRPSDSLELLTAPFPIGNPLTWLWAEAALEDGSGEILYEYGKRVRGKGLPAPRTVGDLVTNWCVAAV